MALLTLRSTRDSALTWEEGDANLLALDSDSPWKVSENHITYDGKVGIAVDSTYTPVYDLDFGNGDSATVGITNGDLVVHVDGPNELKVWNNTVQSITVKTTGKVGINDSDPSEMLTVGGNLRVSDTTLSNVMSANSITDGILSISSGNINTVKRLAVFDKNVEIQFGNFYSKADGHRIYGFDQILTWNNNKVPTSFAVYSTIDSINVSLQNEIDLLTDSLNNQVNIINGQFDSLNGKLETNVNLLQGNITNLENSLSSTSLQDVTDVGSSTTNNITAASFIKSGGTASQYLKADGSTSTDDDMTAGKVANSFTVQGTSFDGSAPKTVTFTGGTGITISGTTITNDLGGTPVSITGGGATTISGSYPAFTVSSTNTTYTAAGTGLSLTGTEFRNTAPDKTVSLTGSGATSVSGTYPNFTISSTNTNTTYTAGTGLNLVGTEFRNAAPDKTVSLTGSGATSVSGTYPNFTISSTNTTYSQATSSALGLVKIGYAANGKNYPVALSNGQMYVSVPWTNTNTTYTAGNGLTLTNTQFKMSGSYTGTFTASGDVVAFSDVAVKENINPITDALSKVEQLGGYTFNRIGESKRSLGVIAQEVQKVIPEAVHENPEGLGVAYGNLTGLLIEAVKELSAKVTELESKK